MEYSNAYTFDGFGESALCDALNAFDRMRNTQLDEFGVLSDQEQEQWSGMIDPRLLEAPLAPTEREQVNDRPNVGYTSGFGNPSGDSSSLENTRPEDTRMPGLLSQASGDCKRTASAQSAAVPPVFGATVQEGSVDMCPVRKAPSKGRSTRKRTGKRLAATQNIATSSQLASSASAPELYPAHLAASSSRPIPTPTVHEEHVQPLPGAPRDADLSIPPRLRLILPRGEPPAPQPLAEPELRGSGRKREASPTYAMDAAPPPHEKRRSVKHVVTEREASDPGFAQAEGAVAGPSSHGSGQSAATAEEDKPEENESTEAGKHKRDRRTLNLVHKDMVPYLEPKTCSIQGCTQLWDPYGYYANQAHLHEHVASEVLASGEKTACIFDGCEEMVSGKRLLLHIGKEHVGLPYLCPIRCGWATARPGYQAQHMRTAHKMVWNSTAPE